MPNQRLNKRDFIKAMAALGGAGAAFAQQKDPGVTDKAITLGTFIPLTGAFASYGVPYKLGIEAYLAPLNQQGGVNGRKIELVIEDNAYNPQRTVAAAKKLVGRDEVLAIAMPFGAGPTEAAFDYLLGEVKVPIVSTYSSPLHWYADAKPNLLGVSAINELQIHVLGRWAAQENCKKAVVVHTATTGFEANAVRFEPGMKTVTPNPTVELVPAKLGTTDYGPIALDVVKRNPDAVTLIMPQQELVIAVKELRQQGYKGLLYTYSPNVTNSALELGGAAMEGVRATSVTMPVASDSPAIKAYRASLAKVAPAEKPDYVSLMGYGLAMITVEAIRRIKGPVTRASLVDSFYSMKGYETGIFPPVSYSAQRHLGTLEVQRVQARGGQWVAVGKFVEAGQQW